MNLAPRRSKVATTLTLVLAIVFAIGIAAFAVMAFPGGTQIFTGSSPPPPPPPPPGVACDYGPNTPVPPPANGAGFTHCFLNADFTDNSSASTGGGWVMNNPNTWAGNCVSSPGNSAYLYLTGMTSGSPQTKTSMACNRLNFITDGSNGRVLDVQWQTSDFTNYTANFVSLSFPTGTDGIGCVGPGCPAGGPNQAGLSAPMYAEIEFKTPSGSWSSLGGFNNGNNAYDFWRDACNCGGTPASFVEVDFFELFVGAACPTNCGGNGQTINGTIKGGASSAAGTTLPALDYTSYHTIGNLITDSGSHAGLCVFVDGGIASNTASSCGDGSSGSVASDHGNLEMWVGNQCSTNPPTNCATTNMDAYIMHIRLFQCANAWNASCSGTVRTSEYRGERKSMFAQLWDLLLPAAHAEPFDRPSMGFWICSDGSEDHTGARCKPEEFKWGRDGNHWWEACMPERDDCVWSDTAFLGWNGIMAKPRGPGYCYSKQPFTCSPDGKWPK